MIYGSVCSGIEAATVAWHPLGWKPAFFSEIEAFPRAVLTHHYPEVPLHGDFTTIQKGDYAVIDLLVGGTPCQSFSVAGLRAGLDDPRGNLMLEFGALARRLGPKWLVWENVPGVLSSNGGRDFGTFLGMLGELGYGFSYRVLDAQYFGVPQRRRRVFVVGCLGDWRAAAAVFFERHSLSGNPAPSREAWKEIAGTITRGAFSGGAGGRPEGAAANHFIPSIARCDTTGEHQRQDFETCTLLGISSQHDVSHGNEPIGTLLKGSPSGGGNPLPAIAFGWQNSSSQGESVSEHITPTLDKSKVPAIQLSMQVRRLTPRECERLQGFPDDYTAITIRNKPAADGPRYKALGNSMAVPCMRWIGERIQAVQDIKDQQRVAA